MKIRWLAVLACLLVTGGYPLMAQDKSETKQKSVKAESEKNSTEKAESAESKADQADDESESKPRTRSERLASIQATYDKALKEFSEAYRDANETERAKLYPAKYPQPADYAEKFLEIVNEDPSDDVAFEALSWVATKAPAPANEKAMAVMFSDHADKEGMKTICSRMYYAAPSSLVEERLRLLIEKSPHDSVKGAATYAMARYMGRVESAKQRLVDKPDEVKLSGKAKDYLRSVDVSSEIVEGFYETLINDYAELKPSERSKRTYKSMAEAALFEMHNLAIGKLAPDIEGKDFDGVSFKLSEYRGKVVVIDFWGDW